MPDAPQSIFELLKRDRRYRLEAYKFVFEALNYAQNVLGLGAASESEAAGSEAEAEPPAERSQQEQHVTGQELCEAIRQYALDQYGLMTQTVLKSWGITSTGDFGEIVFNLIHIGKMRKTPTDRREDFDNVYDFDAAFRQGFRIGPVKSR